MRRPFFPISALNASALCLGLTALPWAPALAVESLEMRVINAPQEASTALEKALRQASPTRRAIEDEITEIPDQIASIQSEYRAAISVLYGQGYYGPSINVSVDGREAADINAFTLPSQVSNVIVTVDPGPQFLFGTTAIIPREPTAAREGRPLEPGFAPGQPAQSGLIGAAANGAVREWRQAGHPKAAIQGDEIIADHRTARLDVSVMLEPGPQLRFGSLTYAGESAVREKRIREMMGLPHGELVTPEALNVSANRLRRTGAFRTVVLQDADRPNPDGTLDYTLSVIDELPRRFGFSAEYSTLDGLLLGGFWLHRNLFGGAERLRIDGQISNIGGQENDDGIDYRADFRLARPAAWGPDNEAFLYGVLERNDEPDYVESIAGIGIGLTRYFADNLFGEVAGGGRYSYVEDTFGTRSFYHFVLPGRLEWDARDQPGDARRGWYIDARVTPGLGLNGSKSFAHFDLDNRAYLSFAQDKVTLAARLQLGSVINESLEETPPRYLFFSGGGDTVRGQRYQSLGGSQVDGQQVGGRSFLGLSTELRTRITRTIGAVAFIDYGIVGEDSWITAESNDHSGIGLGLRYDTPIGPVRVDLATPYSGPEEAFSRAELYIGVGQAF